MPLTYLTYDEFVAQIRAEFRNQLPSVDPTVFGSWSRAFVDGNAVLAQSNQDLIRDLEKQLFPQTATGDFLALWGGYEDLERKAASASFGNVTLEGTPPMTIPVNTNFTGSNGIVYQTQAPAAISVASQNITSLTSSGTTATAVMSADHQLATGIEVKVDLATDVRYNITATIAVTARDTFTYQIAAGATSPDVGSPVYSADIADIPVKAQSTGLTTNIDSGAQIISETYGTALAQHDGLTGGSSEETDEEYRARILLSRSIRDGVFTPDQIKLAALSFAGNTRVFIKKPTIDIVSSHTITTLTSVTTTATADCAEDHGLQTGMEVTVSGAATAKYNITATITRVDDDTFTYPIVAGTDPATDSGVWVGIGNYLLPEPGQCSVFFLRDNDPNIIPTQTVLDATKDVIISDGALPANTAEDDLFVKAPTLVSTNFTFNSITPDTPTMRTAVEDQLEAFFADSVDFETDVTEASYLGDIQNTQDLQTGAFIESFDLAAPSGDITVSDGEIAALGTVAF